MRKYELSYLAPSGTVETAVRLAPAATLFEAPFMALARGTLIATPEGPIAIEDIEPGMSVSSADIGEVRVMWRGSTTVVPGARGQSEQSGRLTRIPSDTMGFGRPAQDLLLGLGARIWRANRSVMVPAEDLLDGETAFSVTPPSPVRVYHLMLESHGCLRANGVEVESFHPGAGLRHLVRPEVKALYLSLFPHLPGPEGFGPLRYIRSDEDGRAVA